MPEVSNPLERPLTFGDLEQIQYLRQEEAKVQYELLPKCVSCEGEGDKECDECGHVQECGDCDGNGKEFKAFEAFCELYPNYKP